MQEIALHRFGISLTLLIIDTLYITSFTDHQCDSTIFMVACTVSLIGLADRIVLGHRWAPMAHRWLCVLIRIQTTLGCAFLARVSSKNTHSNVVQITCFERRSSLFTHAK